ncbi:MAG: P-type conjugative transfer protein TrbJ [Pseudomonadota bacterium]
MYKKLIPIQVALIFIITAPAVIAPAQATGFPVIDIASIAETVKVLEESEKQTKKQIEQYRTQLDQYQNMLQNTRAPASYIWDKASQTMNNLRGAIDTLQYYKTNLGSIDRYLSKFKDVAGYRNSPCFSPSGCSNTEWDALRESQNIGSEAQKKSTDALLKGLDKQQDAMEADARQLEQLQNAAQGADGQMKAIGFANQLASQQANQLLQIRALLIAQQNVIATRTKVLADLEAKQQAAHEAASKHRGPENIPLSPILNW